MEKNVIFDSYFSPLVKDYLRGNDKLTPFYTYTPNITGLQKAMENRRFTEAQRHLLVNVLTEQAQPLGKIHQAVKENITALSLADTYTVTTGHQICLLTGPLYFIFKIASAIKLAQQLQAQFPDKKFVPVYWAATEDHDFEEIQSVFINGKKYTWTPPEPVGGATGKISTHGLDTFFSELESAEGEKLSYNKVYQVFKKAWTGQPNLSAAVRRAVYDLFGHLGIVCIDADDARLKASCTDWLRKELTEQFSFHAVKETTARLQDAGYKPQIEPREVNLFLLGDGTRERIVKHEGSPSFTLSPSIEIIDEEALLSELQQHPEKFSPNVVLRPLYQEAILPNLAYIGGPAEIAYWLQLKGVFTATDIDFPVLIPRDGFLFAAEKDVNRMLELGFSLDDMLRDAYVNLRHFIDRTQGESLSVEEERKLLVQLFSALKQRYLKTDNHVVASFSAVEKKLEKELIKLEKKAKKFAGKKDEETASFLKSAHANWFPGGTLAERKESIIEFWGILGTDPAEALVEKANPLEPGLKVIEY